MYRYLKVLHLSSIVKTNMVDSKKVTLLKAIMTFLLKRHKQNPISRVIEEGVFIVNRQGEILNTKTEWHQSKINWTSILQGGAEMAGCMMVNCQLAARQAVLPATVVNVKAAPLHQGIQGATSRNTRAMARVAGGL